MTIPPLDQLLLDHGFPLGPNSKDRLQGYMTIAQKLQFCERLKTYSSLKKIAEIGLNAGHSAETFLETCPHIERFVSFDLGFYKYTEHAVDYFKKQHGDLFHFVKGDSMATIKEYAKNNPKELFDLIYIDGCHQYEYCLEDIQNCATIAHPETILWIDDYQYIPIFLAVHKQVNEGLIQIIQIHESHDPEGERCWVEAKYLFPPKTL